MKGLIILGLAALALAKIPSQSWESEMFGSSELASDRFQRGSEYEFHYNGQVATGIPGASPQHSATRLQAKCSLVLKGANKAILAIHNIRIGKMNSRLSAPRVMAPFMGFEESSVSSEMLAELQLPVMFSYQEGMVSDLVFDGKERPWSANIKKGILNMLQVNLGKRGEVAVSAEAQVLSQLPRDSQADLETFATHEKTVEGECETLYTVAANPNHGMALNVTRTIQFENCKQRPELKYNFRFQDPCPSCEPKFTEDQKFMKSSSVAKFNIVGGRESFLIQSAEVQSQYQMVPFNREGNVIVTYTTQNLQLTRSGPIRSNIRQPSQPKQADSGLVYTLDWDAEMEAFLMKGQEEARLPVDMKQREEILVDLLRPLVSQMRGCVGDMAPVKYSQLVKILRLTEKSQLDDLVRVFIDSQPEAFSREEHQKVKAVFTDALADAGSKDAISTLFSLIKAGKINPARAAITVKQLMHIRTASKEIVREFLRLLDSEVCRENWLLKQSVQLTMGSVVAGLCMPSEDRLAVLPRPSSEKLPRRITPDTNLCPQQLQDQLIQKFVSIVEQADTEEETEEAILALKTIGNMGIPKSVVKLGEIIKNKATKPLIRIEAILALRQLREMLPQKVTQMLLPIFMTKREPSEVRIAAAFQLLQTLPGRPVLDQMAHALYSERSHQVASFVYTYMQSLANSSNPCEEALARDLQLALRHGRKIMGAYQAAASKYLHASSYSRKFRAGADVNVAAVMSSQTRAPVFAGLSFHATALGFWSRNLASISVSQENVEALAARYLRRTEFSDLSLDEVLSRGGRAAAGPAKELKAVWKALKTAARSAVAQGAPKAFASLMLKDQEFMMLPITQQSIRKLPSMQQLRRQLEEGIHFNLHKAAFLHEMEYKIPSAIGLPIIVNFRIPSVAQVSGQIRIESRSPYKLHINSFKPAAASAVLTQVSVWSPIVSSGAKVVATAKACVPLTAKLEINLKKAEPEAKIIVMPEAKSEEFLRLETRPMTWTRDYRFPLTAYPKAQYKTIVGEEWNRLSTVQDIPIVKATQELIKQVTGQAIRIEGAWHRTPINAPAYLPVCPFSGPNAFVIRSQASAEQPKEYILKLSGQMKTAQEQMEMQPIQMEEYEVEVDQEQEQQAAQLIIKSEALTKTNAGIQRKAAMQTKIAVSPSLRKLNAESEITIEPLDQLNARPVQLCSKAAVQYAKPAQRFNQLAGKGMKAVMKTTWGHGSCQEQNKVEIKVAGKHSAQQERMMESDSEMSYWSNQDESQPELYAPIDMQEASGKAHQLYQYNLIAKYSDNLHPTVKNITAKAFRALKYVYYWNTDEKIINLNKPANTIRAQLSIDAKNRQFFNLSVKAPTGNVEMTDAELPMAMIPARISAAQSQIRSPADFLENVMAGALPECRISTQRLATFDGAEIRAPLTDCWTLLSKDCQNADQPAYAVLVKKQEGSQQKAVKIISPAKTVLLIPDGQAYGQIKVKVNGKQISAQQMRQRYSEDAEQVQIQAMPEQEQVKVTLPAAGVRVYSDGYSVKVQASPVMGGRLCGVCGDADSQQGEYQTPEGRSVQDARRFLQAHTVQEAGCSYPELSDIDSSSEELSYQPRWEQDQEMYDSYEAADKSASASSEEWDREVLSAPVRKHLVEEEGDKMCISAEAVPVCPAYSMPQEYEGEQEAVFKCIYRSHPKAHAILREIRAAESGRISSSMPSWVSSIVSEAEAGQYRRSVNLPAACRQQ